MEPRRAAGGGRRAAGGGRAKLVRKPRASKPGKPSEADYAQAIARCLKGEKVSAVSKDLGMVYATLYGRVVAAREAKPASDSPAPAAVPAAKKGGWV